MTRRADSPAPTPTASGPAAHATDRLAEAAGDGSGAAGPAAVPGPAELAATDVGPSARGVLWMLMAALGFSVMGLLVKVASTAFPTMELVFARSAFMSAVAFGTLRLQGGSALGVDRRTLLLRGAAGATALSLFYFGIGRLPLGDAVTIQYTAPVWTALAAALILGERVRPVVAASAVVSLAGVALVARPAVLFGDGVALDGLGVAAVASAAVLSGLAYTFVRKLRQTDRPMTIIFYLSWIGMVGALPFALGGWVMPSGAQWLLLLGIGVATHTGQVGLTKGMQTLEAGTASAVGYVQVVLAFVWGAVFLGDAVDGLSVAGAALVVSGVLLVVRRARAPVAGVRSGP